MCRAVGRTRTSGTELEVEKRREKCGEKRKVGRGREEKSVERREKYRELS